jgi:glycosyltransferase involved in cell wall biosynthesis
MNSNEKKKHIVIVTDAWTPQVNGVVNTLEHITEQLRARGHTVSHITPDQFHTLPLPYYPEIKLAIWHKGRTLSGMLEDLQPDQIYIATEGPLGHAAVEYCNRRHLNFTTGYHTKFPEYVAAFGVPAGESLGYSVMRRFHKYAQHVMVPTASIAKELEAHGFDNLVTWTRGVNTKRFYPGETEVYRDLGIAEGEPVFLNVGRVSVEKGLEDFLKLDLPGKKVIVGKGPMLEEFRKKYPDAMFVGEKRGEELAAYYRGADVFVFPSKTDTFGNVQLEALASGVPVAAYPVAGPVDVITSPEVGALDNDLKSACLKALELKKAGCGKACHDFVTQNYTWDKAASILEENLVDVGAPNRMRRYDRDMWEHTSRRARG